MIHTPWFIHLRLTLPDYLIRNQCLSAKLILDQELQDIIFKLRHRRRHGRGDVLLALLADRLFDRRNDKLNLQKPWFDQPKFCMRNTFSKNFGTKTFFGFCEHTERQGTTCPEVRWARQLFGQRTLVYLLGVKNGRTPSNSQ